MVRYQSPWTKVTLQVEPLETLCVPTTLTPTTFADGGLGSGSLRDAILQFNADTGTEDDIIQLEAGSYALTIRNAGNRHETAGLAGDLNLTQTSHRWIIQGAGPSTYIDASQLQDRVFEIVNPGTQVVFQNLTIQGGLAQDDGSDGALAGTTNALGGSILNNGSDITLENVLVKSNMARGGDTTVLTAPGHNASGGGIYSTGGALTLVGATVANNQVIGGRGGNHDSAVPGGNGGSASGGGLYATGGSLDISASIIASNQATGGRGGDGYLTCCNPSSSDSYSYYTAGGRGGSAPGAGLYVDGGSLTIAASTIASNRAIGDVGGLGGGVGFGQGGGLYNGGVLTVSNSALSGNSIGNYGYGGGLYNSGTLTVRNSTLAGNSATTAAGGIHNTGTLTLSDSTLTGNTATNYDGGGISNGGTVMVTNSTLAGNSASRLGGGIVNTGTLTVSNSTLSGNSALVDGGGIYTTTRPVTLTNVTLTANRANSNGSSGGRGGGLFVGSGSPVVLHNTLIAGNFSGTGATRSDVSGSLSPGGDYNLIGDGTGMTGLRNGVNGNLVGSAAAPIDPLLGPLQDNGGPTLTHALLPGSPAIGAGDKTGHPRWDQRGRPYRRVVNHRMDIGAFEVQSDSPGPSVPGNGRSEGPIRVPRISARPLPTDAWALRSVAPFRDSKTTLSLNRDSVPKQEVESDPKAAVVDQFFTSLEEPAQRPRPVRWPDLEPIQSIGSNRDLLTEAAGLIQ